MVLTTRRSRAWLTLVGLAAGGCLSAAEPFQVSGIYPHLATFNHERECGTGAVVPWADRLWVVTYAPHSPKGSSDKLYEITPDLRQIVRPESIGGTPANRMIHRESQQLFIGPYAIDAQRNVRVIPYEKMFGRPTGTARHLSDPAGKVYYASMEEGFYEVDVRTLAVTELFRDEAVKGEFRRANLPGYHGKGLFSGQGLLVYANNGENSPLARQKPDIPSGALATWDGKSDAWTVVRRNQFTEVSGPGGIYGNEKPDTDPIWTIGWDHRSLILMVMAADGNGSGPAARAPKWHSYRLPKASHSYDGAHGWNTEWPRIRDIGEKDLLMTMHGTFWRFPRDFGPGKSAGIAPRSNYLKVVGDFARWGDKVVLGCDDTAASEFLNKRRAKGELAAPGQSQSNLVFLEPAALDRFGPAIGRGAVWLDDAVKRDEASDAFLFSGYEQRGLHLAHDAGEKVTFAVEVDREGNGRWTKLRDVDVGAGGYAWVAFRESERGAWVRLRAMREVGRVTAQFVFRNGDRRGRTADPRFAGLAQAASGRTGGLLHARGQNKRTLAVATTDGYYEMGPEMALRRTDEAGAREWMEKQVAIPRAALAQDAASVIYTDEAGKRWRLPRVPGWTDPRDGTERAVREVCTERDLLNAGGTFFELPAENAGGVAKVRPVASHGRHVHDYATWRGLLVMSGLELEESAARKGSKHVIRSEDVKTAVWVGSVDDLWAFGRAVGVGGPWKDAKVKAGEPSEPYLMTGYERKRLELSHRAAQEVRMRVEVDITGAGKWVEYASYRVPAGKTQEVVFPTEFQAYWVRVVSEVDTQATAWLVYE